MFNNDILLIRFALHHAKRPTADPCSFPGKKGNVKGRVHQKIHGYYQYTNVTIPVLCLDRGFHSNEVFSFLQMANILHIVPVRKHG